MSKKQQNNYSSEFRTSAVKLAIESDQPIAATARDLGINVNTLHTWINNQLKPDNGTVALYFFSKNLSKIQDLT